MFTTKLLAPLFTLSMCVLLTKATQHQQIPNSREASWDSDVDLLLSVTPTASRPGEPDVSGDEVHNEIPVPVTEIARGPGEGTDLEDEEGPDHVHIWPVPSVWEYFPENHNCSVQNLYWQDDCTVKYIEPYTEKEKSNCLKFCRSRKFQEVNGAGYYQFPTVNNLMWSDQTIYESKNRIISGFPIEQCSFLKRSPVPRRTITQTEKQGALNEYNVNLKRISMILQNYVTNVFVNLNRQGSCPFVRKAPVAEFPTAKQAVYDQPMQVLQAYYRSLLYHAAHMFFVANQHHFSKLTSSCLNLTESAFITQYIAQNLVQTSCNLRLVILQLSDRDSVYVDKFFKDLEKELEKEVLEDLRQHCPASKIRDCSVIYSSMRMLTEMNRYMKAVNILNPYICLYELSV